MFIYQQLVNAVVFVCEWVHTSNGNTKIILNLTFLTSLLVKLWEFWLWSNDAKMKVQECLLQVLLFVKELSNLMCFMCNRDCISRIRRHIQRILWKIELQTFRIVISAPDMNAQTRIVKTKHAWINLPHWKIMTELFNKFTLKVCVIYTWSKSLASSICCPNFYAITFLITTRFVCVESTK